MTIALDTELQLYKDAFLYDTAAKAIVNPDGYWLRYNTSFANLLGIREQELSRLNLYELFPQIKPQLERMLSAAGDARCQLELSYTPPSGEPRTLQLELALVRRCAKALYFLLHLSEQPSKEWLARSEKLSMAGQLAAGIAHEIRNPLTALKGFLKLLQSSESKRDYYLDIMESELIRIEDILGEMLLLAKPQKVQFAKKQADDLLRPLVSLLQAQAVFKGIEIVHIAAPPDCPLIYCDENQIKQVLVNLIKNAIEAMPGGGRIELSTGADRDYVRISISDEGTGIPEDQLARLGEPFFSTKEKGTGLGLTVSYRIIENHRGRIEVRSRAGCGTKFTICLPIAGRAMPYVSAHAGASRLPS